MTRLITTLALLLICPILTAQAQEGQKEELARYQKDGGWDLPLYRGKQMTDYTFRFNGTYFWDHKGYRPASICYGGKVYENILMNIDAYRQALYVKYGDKIQSWELDRDLVDWALFGDVKVVNLRAKGVDKAPEGFFEVVYEGEESVFRQVTKSYKESLEVSGYSRLGYEDPNYNHNYLIYFEFHESFYFLDKNGKFEKFSSRKYLVKKHPGLKKQLRAKIKESNWGNEPFAVWCKNIMTFIESAK